MSAFTIIQFQFSSIYDRDVPHFVSRVATHLRDSIHVLVDKKFTPIEPGESVIMGDIIDEKYYSPYTRTLEFYIGEYPNEEKIIEQINYKIFGLELVDIPDNSLEWVVKFIYTEPYHESHT